MRQRIATPASVAALMAALLLAAPLLAGAAEPGPPPEPPEAAPPEAPGAAPPEAPAPKAEAPEPAAPPEAPAERALHVSGRVIYTWYEQPKRRVILVIDGFTVVSRQEQVTAHDGVVWFDEEEAEKTGRARLGVYGETGVEVRRPDGRVEKYDSVYLVLEDGAEVGLHSDLPLRGRADAAPLYLRARKRQREFVERGVPEEPRAVVPPAPPAARPPAPGVREAGVPQEILVVPRDDVSQVNFTSHVEDGMRISVWTGGVYVMRGEMEMSADHVVIWVPEEAARRAAEGRPARDGERLAAEAYFEGNVRIAIGHRQLFCSQLYYDFRRDTALAVDAKIKTFSRARNVPIYYYAKEVRQLAQGVFVGKDAYMTTDEFAVPNYDMGAREMTLVDLTPVPTAEEEVPEYRRVRFIGKDVQFRVRKVPLTWWPEVAGDFAEGETALRTIRVEHSTNLGTGLTTQWHLMKLLGLERPPPGFRVYLNADLWSDRGPGLGVESKYLRENFFGEFLSYYLHDSGKDSVGSTDREPPSDHRGRVLWRHRHYLPENWEMTLELSYLSDAGFLNEFYEQEEEEEKAQETLLYLKKQMTDAAGLPTNRAMTLLASWRLNDWYTRTEYLPQVGYNVIGHSLLGDRLTYFQDSEVGWARYRPADRLGARGSHGELVGDTIHEFDLPLRAGPVGVVPFYEGRVSYFEENARHDDHVWRFYQRAGARAAVQAWRVYPGVESDFWDVHGIRHINTFDVRAYAANVTVPMERLIPYDPTEAGTPVWQGVNDVGVAELGWRQRFQTKRGPPADRRTIDWLTLDLEATFYDDRDGPFELAPDGKRAFNHLDFRTDWRVTDSATLWTDTNYNINDGTLDLFTVGATITHTPRLTYSVGHRYIPDGNTARAFLSADYRINEKWRVSFLEQYDFDRQGNAQSHFILTRRMNRWLVRLRLELDPGEDERFIGVELQPMGAPEVRLGL